MKLLYCKKYSNNKFFMKKEEKIMVKPFQQGINCVIGKDVHFGNNVRLAHNVIIEDGVQIGDDVYIDSNTIVRSGVEISAASTIGANCILGEHLKDWYQDHQMHEHPLRIGKHAIIRSHTTIYGDSTIGDYFQTGHYVDIREHSEIGAHVSVGNYSDIQGYVKIGNYVRFHSNDRIEQYSIIDDYVWIFPGVELTNDPTPPSNDMMGVHIYSFAILCANVTVLAGREVKGDALVGAGSVVTKTVEPYQVVVGNPARVVADIRTIRNKKTGELAYPWRYHFNRAMPWEESDYDTWLASFEK